MSDPYLDPQSGILRNKFGLTDQNSLDREEGNTVYVRSMLLKLNPIKGNFDSLHLQQIHENLFQDVYAWAGQFRTIDMFKLDQNREPPMTRFTPADSIERELGETFKRLSEDDFLAGLEPKEFARKAAGLLSDINRIHPFREGNGRAQRHFVRQLAESVGHRLRFEVISKERMIQASILSANGDVTMMERLTEEIVSEERVRPTEKVIDFFERQGFPWNDHYIAATMPGRDYAGTFAGRGGANFYFRDEQNRILVGNMKDLENEPNPGDAITFTAR